MIFKSNVLVSLAFTVIVAGGAAYVWIDEGTVRGFINILIAMGVSSLCPQLFILLSTPDGVMRPERMSIMWMSVGVLYVPVTAACALSAGPIAAVASGLVIGGAIYIVALNDQKSAQPFVVRMLQAVPFIGIAFELLRRRFARETHT